MLRFPVVPAQLITCLGFHKPIQYVTKQQTDTRVFGPGILGRNFILSGVMRPIQIIFLIQKYPKSYYHSHYVIRARQ